MFLLSKMLWLSLTYSANEKEDQHSRKALLRGSRIDNAAVGVTYELNSTVRYT